MKEYIKNRLRKILLGYYSNYTSLHTILSEGLIVVNIGKFLRDFMFDVEDGEGILYKKSLPSDLLKPSYDRQDIYAILKDNDDSDSTLCVVKTIRGKVFEILSLSDLKRYLYCYGTSVYIETPFWLEDFDRLGYLKPDTECDTLDIFLDKFIEEIYTRGWSLYLRSFLIELDGFDIAACYVNKEDSNKTPLGINRVIHSNIDIMCLQVVILTI